MPVPPRQPVLECSIELLEVVPRVWRRLLVPASVRLDKLHRMFQAAMGWQDRHLHSFEIGGERYGMQLDEYPDEEVDERSVTVVSAVGTNQRFRYEYDFGDSWEHEVTVHGVRRTPSPAGSAADDRGGQCHPMVLRPGWPRVARGPSRTSSARSASMLTA